MSASIAALSITSVIVAIGSLAGFLAHFRRKMDLEQWTVAGRGFGMLLVWLLMAGEIYTTFTFLGVSAYWERAIQGGIILSAVVMDALGARLKKHGTTLPSHA